jgi:hypothetical protein
LSSPLMYVLIILCLLVFPTITLRNFISTACSLLSSLLVHVHVFHNFKFFVYIFIPW